MSRPSLFCARIKGDVLAIIAAVPKGVFVTFNDIVAHLDVAPRHEAAIPATLDPVDTSTVSWFRVEPDDGSLAKPKAGLDRKTQRQLLAEEIHAIAPDGRMFDLARRIKSIDNPPHGVRAQTWPANAPRGSSQV